MGLFQNDKRTSDRDAIIEFNRILELMNEHGHDLKLYNELHGAMTAIKWILLSGGPPSEYYFDSLDEDKRLIDRQGEEN